MRRKCRTDRQRGDDPPFWVIFSHSENSQIEKFLTVGGGLMTSSCHAALNVNLIFRDLSISNRLSNSGLPSSDKAR